MKRLSIYILFILAICYSQTLAFGQSSPEDYSGLISHKYVGRNPDNPFAFTITFETFVTGTEIHSASAIDVALILDLSFSMNEISTGNYESYGTGAYNISTITGLADWNAAKGLPCPSGTVTLDGSGQKAYFTNFAILEGGVYYPIALAQDNSYYIHLLAVQKNDDGSAYNIIHDYGKKGSSKFNELAFETSVTLYQTSEVGRKIDLLKNASNTFIDILAGSASSSADHYLSILGFNNAKYLNGDNNITESAAGDGATVIKQFKQMTNSSNVTALHNAINNSLDYKGQTYPTYAVNLTEALYTKQKIGSTYIKDNGHQKVIVLMTDGEPGSSSFNESTANSTVAAIHTLKSTYNAKVYTVGVFDQNISVSNTYQYMNAASSNYPNATSYNVGDATAHDYFRVVGDKSLEEIFSDIAEEVVSGSPSVNVNSSNSYVMDYMGAGFNLPEGISINDVSIAAYKCNGYNSTTDVFSFETTEVDPKTLTNSAGTSITFDETEHSIKIAGFDYASNYVRVVRMSGQPDTYDGYKICVSFPIEIDPSNPGGMNIPTNTTSSGMYYDSDGDSEYDQISYFDVPIVKIPNIVVVKNGMDPGESALIKIECLDAGSTFKPITLVLSPKEGETSAQAVIKFVQVGRYRATELGWSWAYDLSSMGTSVTKDDADVTEEQWHAADFGDSSDGYFYPIPSTTGTNIDSNSITRNVNDFTIESSYNATLFDFTNTAKTSTPVHDENLKVNSYSPKGAKGVITVSDPTTSTHKFNF